MRHRTHRFAIPLALTLTAILAAATFAGKGGSNGGNDNTNYAFVYVAGEQNKSGNFRQPGLYLATIDGATTRQLTSGGSSPAWSPDLDPDTAGYQGVIAYYDFRGGDREIWTVDPVTGETFFIKSFRNEYGPYSSSLGGKTALSWSPNGRELLYATGSYVATIEVATGNKRILVDGDGTEAPFGGPVASSLGLLAFEHRYNLYTVDYELDEDGLIQVDPAAQWTWIKDGFNAAWSPDGTRLAFVDAIPVPGRNSPAYDLVVYDLLYDDFQVVLNNDNEVGDTMEPTWSPDALQLAFHRRHDRIRSDGDIYRVTNWDDPELRQIINVTRTEVTADGGWSEGYPNWSPGWIRE